MFYSPGKLNVEKTEIETIIVCVCPYKDNHITNYSVIKKLQSGCIIIEASLNEAQH